MSKLRFKDTKTERTLSTITASQCIGGSAECEQFSSVRDNLYKQTRFYGYIVKQQVDTFGSGNVFSVVQRIFKHKIDFNFGNSLEVLIDVQPVKVANYEGGLSAASATESTYLGLTNIQEEATDAEPLGYNVFI